MSRAPRYAFKCNVPLPNSPTIRHIGQPLNDILPFRHTNNRHARNLPNPPLQIPVIRRNQIDPVLLHAVHNAVVRIRALVIALQSLPALVSRDAQGYPVLGAELFQLGHDAGCDYGRGFGVEQVHEGFVELELGVDGVREEVGVDEDVVGWPKGGVGLEEEGGRDLRAGRVLAALVFDRVQREWTAHFSLRLGFFLLLRGFDLAGHLVLFSTPWLVQEVAGWRAHRGIQSGITLACDSQLHATQTHSEPYR